MFSDVRENFCTYLEKHIYNNSNIQMHAMYIRTKNYQTSQYLMLVLFSINLSKVVIHRA